MGQAIGAFEAGDAGLDAGAEIAELAINPVAPDHVFNFEAALLVEGAMPAAIISPKQKPAASATCTSAASPARRSW
jgi:hypothetical protein